MELCPGTGRDEHVQLKEQYSLFINGKFTAPAQGKYFDTINPATEKKIASVANAGASDVNKAVKAARAAHSGVWSKMPAAERGKYLYRIARILQEKARELAVIESMDGGKPIRESRDIDVPLAAAHFFYYAGWADKIEYVLSGRKSPFARSGGTNHPLEFPAPDGGMENCSCACLR